ncbi:hypothetical protein ACFWQC_02830 [Nocardioides sp. NPDC058538]|uniref:hypothetical protein n=1 Tax=Nocardioides sp. NPDC058538 TaxID=3346542 RepID=UPI0036655A44
MTSPTCLILNCTLKRSPDESSSALLGSQILSALMDYEVKGEMVRVVDHDVRFGVSTDEGDGDAWPQLRERILPASSPWPVRLAGKAPVHGMLATFAPEDHGR